MPYMRNDHDIQAENWWATISGAGTGVSGIDPSWADDYTRHRDGTLVHDSTEFGNLNMTKHSTSDTTSSGWPNHPTDARIGRKDGHTGRELDKNKAEWD